MKCLIPIILYHAVEAGVTMLIVVALLVIAYTYRQPKKRGN